MKYSYFNVIYHKAVKGWGQMRLGDFGKLEIKTFDENILEAGLSLGKPGAVTCSDCSKDYTYSYSVTFRVNLNAGKEESTKPATKPAEIIISGDDTPPGKAYASYYKAKMAGNIDEIKKWVVREHVKDFDDEMGKTMIKMSMELFPKEVKIVNTAISGNSAKLTVKGVTDDKDPATGSVEMVLEDGQWKVNTDKWK